MKNTKILILNDGKKFSNWGIQAATDGIINILKQKIDNVEFLYLPHSILIKNYSFDPKIFNKRLFNRNSRVASRLFKENIEIPRVTDEFDFTADKWIKGEITQGSKTILRLIEKSDVVVYNAEGSTYRNNRSAMRALFLLWLSSNRLNKKSYFLNGSVTITSVDSIMPAMINKTFLQIDGVSLREPESFDNLISIYPKLKEKLRVVPDSAFSVEASLTSSSDLINRLDLDEDFFCFSTSMLPIDYKNTKSQSAIVDLINKVKRKTPKIVILARDIEDQFLSNLAKETDAILIDKRYTYSDVMYILSKSKFLISGRYHHLIFAAKAGCPCIPFNTTSHKIVGLSRLFEGIMPLAIDPTDLRSNIDNIIQNVDYILDKGQVLRDKYRKVARSHSEAASEHANIVIGNKL
jgi:polysaccharide pyruvyl transferase WcaK-like protein